MEVIKWFQDASWEQQVLLDFSLYILQASWNIRSEGWYVSLYTNEKVPLFEGKRVNINIDLLAQVSNINKPKGYLMVVPIAKEKGVEVISRDNMGTEVELIFIGIDEVL
jgi:hypothetical protein